MNSSNPILFFDGVCNLCNKSVDFIIRNDKQSKFRFASLQSDYAQNALKDYPIDPKELGTVVLLVDNEVYSESRAGAQILIQLGGWKSIFGRLINIFPRCLADWGYSVIASNRYRWFGQAEVCRIPSPSKRSLFLD